MADYDDVIALWLSCSEMELNDVDDTPEGIGRFLEKNPETCLVAEENGEICGVVLGGCDGRRGYIYHAAVSPRYRGNGIGSALVNRVLEILREMGISKVGLLTFADNDGGNRFWEKHGFAARTDLIYHSNVLRDVHRIGTVK